MSESGNTTTSQLPQRALSLRFLTRTEQEVTQMRELLADDRLVLEPAAIIQLSSIAHKISNTADLFGFPEISAIGGAIELLAHEGGGRTVRDRVALAARLKEQVAALAAHLQQEIEERSLEAAGSPSLAECLPALSARGK